MGKSVLIVGGGIVGLSCAYYLHKEGHEVTVIDKSGMDGGASYVNAGYLTPSHIIPLASPGMMAKGIKWMFNSSSPFYMKPRLDDNFLRWAWAFNRSSTRAHVEKAIPLIREINVLSKDLYIQMHGSGELGDFHLEKKGLLMLYKTRKEGQHEKEVARRASDEGLEVTELTRNELDRLQPGLSPEIEGAVHYLCDAHTSPNEIMDRLKMYLRVQGVVILQDEEVIGFTRKNRRITGTLTSRATYTTDEVVLAGGAWTSGLLQNLGIKLLLQAGKGYRINVPRPLGIHLPAILMEAKVAVTPMRDFTRFAGTMEFSGINHRIRSERVEAIARAAQAYYTDLEIRADEKQAAKCGLRPVSPDGLPYIGKTSHLENLTIATGHAMMGWSLGPATGKLVSEVISDLPLSMPLDGFHPERRF
ncbi:D-amino-acid dehydrogenase [Muriicola jejuensis]|uniref:FAD-dependent oxidoreductase n=1 Tax=Muriicola jejuensis TaxID=504488 RepID=A0A6P0U761_9FLAO|nr:FAD-dependent oxidoreductase [Muriicola jejuensis]NER09111.1 FAD-dependent oxidoreductase [Muriicola jejuensis]SMP11059.1 D-amino-acid dehydrogenase [Muriicola jejuensis]